VKAGDLKHRITIEQLTVTNDDEATTEAWTTFAADVPARSRPLSGKEVAAVGTTLAGTMRAFEIRYGNSVGVTYAMRISHEGVTYNITSILPDETLRDSVVIIGEAGIRNG
jgi:SPP1 family predicted phage head-tail adaptor